MKHHLWVVFCPYNYNRFVHNRLLYSALNNYCDMSENSCDKYRWKKLRFTIWLYQEPFSSFEFTALHVVSSWSCDYADNTAIASFTHSNPQCSPSCLSALFSFRVNLFSCFTHHLHISEFYKLQLLNWKL